MSKDSSEKYLDNLLNSINGNQSAGTFGNDTNDIPISEESEDDFLKQFENELAADEYNDYIADFEIELEAEKNHDKKIDVFGDDDNDELSLDEVLANAESKAGLDDAEGFDEDSKENFEIEQENESDRISDDFGEDDFNELDAAVEVFDSHKEEDTDDRTDLNDEFGDIQSEPPLSMTEIGEPDLAGNGDVALEDMLGGEFSEIGDLLSGDVDNPEGDEFDNFAEQEMKSNVEKVGEPEGETSNSEEKKGFFARIIEALFGSNESENSDSVDSVGIDDGMTNLSDENAQILMELEGTSEEQNNKKAKKEKKPKKEKKAKPKKEKPKKEKKPKVKKEKKPKVKDNTPPLPKGPVIMIWIMVGSMFLFVMLCTNLIGYSSNINQAKSLYLDGQYSEAFKQVEGLDIKESDKALYDKLRILGSISSELESYKSFSNYGKQLMAFDSLVCSAGRCNHFEEDVEELKCTEEYDALRQEIEAELKDKYSMSFDDAVQLYKQKDRNDYTVAIYKKLAQLGIVVE